MRIRLDDSVDESNFIFIMCDRRTTYYCVINVPSPYWLFIEDLCHFLKVKDYIFISKQSLKGFIKDAVWQKVKGAYCAEVHSLKVKIRSQKAPVTRHIDNFTDLKLLLGEDLLSVLSTTMEWYVPRCTILNNRKLYIATRESLSHYLKWKNTYIKHLVNDT